MTTILLFANMTPKITCTKNVFETEKWNHTCSSPLHRIAGRLHKDSFCLLQPIFSNGSSSQHTHRGIRSTRQGFYGTRFANGSRPLGGDISFIISRRTRPLWNCPCNGYIRRKCTPSLQATALRSEREFSRLIAETDVDDDNEDIEHNIDDSDIENELGNVIQETWTMFEWAAICAQVAQFASTPMGISLAGSANLTIGATQSQSEELLQQTAAACALPAALDFSGIENIKEIIGEAMSGIVCRIDDLCGVKATLIGIRSLYNQLGLPAEAGRLSSLQALMSDCELCSDLVSEIDYCLDCKLVTVLDRASSRLAEVRYKREENMKDLETLLRDTASRVVQKGGMDSVIVTLRRKRLCIAVRTSHKSLLPGGVVLDVSNTGTTSFMEPEPALTLNNEENRLAAREKVEELAVLESLTLKLIDKADAIMDLLGRVTVLDLACARGAHARWLGSVCPLFSSRVNHRNGQNPLVKIPRGNSDKEMVSIDGLRHPILLGNALPSSPSSQRHGGALRPNSPDIVPYGANSNRSKSDKLPVPVDIKVKANVRVVTITGPNTGGKTATLKAIGVAAIMAKAGLFLPALGQPKLPWFDLVLADIGDSQSLERSLSTFSGHIRRLSAILELCTDRSLVLLDEIGGGTDPSEGASLASAVLQHLSSTVWLTIATTHSAELKLLKEQDSRFENASVEFDLATLKPTYRVLWGVAGQSNALDIAENLGFNQAVTKRARELVGKLRKSQLGVQTGDILEALTKQRDVLIRRAKEADDVLVKAKNVHLELKEAAENLAKREAAQRKQDERTAQRNFVGAQLRIDEVIKKFQEATEQVRQDDNSLLRGAQAEIAAIVEEFTPAESTIAPELYPEESHYKSSGSEGLSIGDEVLVKRLGKAPVTIKELPRSDTDNLTVQLGTLKLQVKPTELLRIRREDQPLSTTATVGKLVQQSKGPPKRQRIDEDEVSSEPKYEVAVRTSKNTLDLRGQRVDDAIRNLNLSLASKRPQSVLFVIHGVGTGAVKEAVYRTLREHSLVAKFEEESLTNAGCTIVYIK